MLNADHVCPPLCPTQSQMSDCAIKRVKKLQLCERVLRQSPRLRIERSPDLTETKPRDRFIAPFLATVSSRQHPFPPSNSLSSPPLPSALSVPHSLCPAPCPPRSRSQARITLGA